MTTNNNNHIKYMRVTKTIRPGLAGSKRYSQRFGDQLVCVRYREDEARNLRLTTVELVIEQTALPRKSDIRIGQKAIPPNQTVSLVIDYSDKALRQWVRQQGAIWNSKTRRWEMPYHKAAKLGLANRIDKNLLDWPSV